MNILSSAAGKRTLLLHLFSCLCFIVLPFLFFPRPQDILAPFNNPITTRDFIGQFLLTGFFYLTYYLLIPRYYQPKKYATFITIVIASFVFVTLLPSVITGRFNSSPPPLQHLPAEDRNYHQPPPLSLQKPGDRSFPDDYRPYLPLQRNDSDVMEFIKEVNHYIFLFLVVLFFSLMLNISNRWKLTQKEKADAELSYLKAQVNPHFLFNTLNCIYSLTLQKSDAAPEAVVKLAGMMRYMLRETDKDMVSLDKEMEHLRAYVELQKLRFGNGIPIECKINGETAHLQIAPLILIGFVENAFKHGINAEENSHISIEVTVSKNELQLKVKNNKVHVQHTEESGTGLQNMKQRLQHIYPVKHSLTIEDTDTYFLVLLTIRLS